MVRESIRAPGRLAVNFIGRVILMPMLAVMIIGVAFLPFMPIALLIDPSIEDAFVLLLLLGMWPMCLAFVHGAYIEHFIVRSISARTESVSLLLGSPYLDLVLWAGDHLARALECEPGALSAETVRRGQALAKRHRTIARMVWYGFAVSTVGGLGLYLIQR